MLRIERQGAPASRVRADVCVVPLFVGRDPGEDVRLLDEATGGKLLREVRRRSADPTKRGVVSTYQTHGALAVDLIVLVGTGTAERDLPLAREAWRRLGGQAVEIARAARAETLAVALAGAGRAGANSGGADRIAAAGALIEGVILGSYRFRTYKSGPRAGSHDGANRLVLLGVPATRAAREAERRARVIAEATCLARDLINHPAEVATPAYLATAAREIARAGHLQARVLGPREMKRLGMGAILGVGQGSVNPPRLIELIYQPPGRARGDRRHVALVGKGITFDSGGLSLKPPAAMEIQKRDMSGGAAVLGAMRAIASLRPAIGVRGYVAAAENMPGGGAYRPGDVLRSYNGKTIEVLNTDAEGRLVLADALAYAAAGAPVRPRRPEWIVDLATLTGAVKMALGSSIAGVMGNDTKLVRRLITAGGDSGEPMWELPLVDEYAAAMESPVADLKNVGDGGAGTIFGGLFLREFVGKVPWAHLDIAAVAYTDRAQPYVPRGAVGWGVRTLVELVETTAA